jgi:hypothetical protein
MSERGHTVLICEIDPAELACRIFEGLNEVERPAGFTARQGLEIIKNTDPDVHRRLMIATHKAAKYLESCVHAGKRPT